jgi:hypothetical protein
MSRIIQGMIWIGNIPNVGCVGSTDYYKSVSETEYRIYKYVHEYRPKRDYYKLVKVYPLREIPILGDISAEIIKTLPFRIDSWELIDDRAILKSLKQGCEQGICMPLGRPFDVNDYWDGQVGDR